MAKIGACSTPTLVFELTVISFPGDARINFTFEMARETRDRVCMLESDHSRLSGQVDSRFASSQEFEDFLLNRAEEDWVEITGPFL